MTRLTLEWSTTSIVVGRWIRLYEQSEIVQCVPFDLALCLHMCAIFSFPNVRSAKLVGLHCKKWIIRTLQAYAESADGRTL